MKEEFDKAIETAIATKNVQLFGKVAEQLHIKYNVSLKTVHNRFHSMYGKGFREYITPLILPTKEELSALILNSDNSESVRTATKLSNRQFAGMYDKYYSVSTFTAAKELLLLTAPINTRLSSLREDNLAILMSQYLGDGSYDSKNHSLRIQHGVKQGAYLMWKVGLIHSGYNTVNQEVKLKLHAQGHQYYDWYSGKLGNVDFPKELQDAVKLLTPLGWLLWYLDDGCYSQDIQICIGSELVAAAANSELQTYGIVSRVNKISGANAYNLTMCGGANSIRFYKAFIEPFLSKIPSCMLYKTKVKI